MEILTLISIPIIIVLLIALSWLWPPDSPWAPWWRTNKKVAREAFKIAKVTKKDIVYELGSGEATALILAAEEFGAKGVGIEIEPIRAILSRLSIKRNGLSGKVRIIKGNFFDEDFSEASVIFVYLVPKTLNRLKPKLLKELKPGSRIISVVYKIPGGLSENAKKNELKPKGLIKSLKIRNNKEIFVYKI